MKTIPRNRRKFIAQLATTHTVCSMYDQSSGNMITTAAQYAWRALDTYPHARLTESSDGTTYTVHVHSNLWYRLTAPAPVEAAPVVEAVEVPPVAAAPLDVTDWWQITDPAGTVLGRVEGATMGAARIAADESLGRDGGYLLQRMVRDAAGALTLAPDPVPPTADARTAIIADMRAAARKGLAAGQLTAAEAADITAAADRMESATWS